MSNQGVGAQFGVGWYVRLLAKFIITAPLSTLTVLACSLLSQAFLLLAFFLPLKVILLIGSPSIPRYFPESWSQLPKDELVLLLAGSAVFFFLLYQLAEFLISHFSEKGSVTVLSSGSSMPLFEQQNELALKAYNQYIRAVSGLMFCLAVIVLLLFVYPKLGLLMTGLGGLATLVVFLLNGRTAGLSNEFEYQDRDERLPGSWLGGVGFLVVFSFIIFELMSNAGVQIPVAVIGLLLARQFFQKYLLLIAGFNYVTRNAGRISSIFLHHRSVAPETIRENFFWSFIKAEQLQRMAESALANVLGKPQFIKNIGLFPADMPPVIPVVVEASENAPEEESTTYLIRVFGAGKRVAAQHEATLLSESLASRLSAPDFVGAASFGSMNCNIFRLSCTVNELKPVTKLLRYDLLGEMLLITPEAELRKRYTRSHPLLHQRFTEEQKKKLLQLAEVSTQGDTVREFVGRLEAFKKILADLPLQVVNPELATGAIWSQPSGNGIALGWSRWAVEPVGSGWPVDEKGLEALTKAFSSAQKRRKALNRTDARGVQLAALLYEIDRRLTRQHFSSAIPLMLRAVENLKARAVND